MLNPCTKSDFREYRVIAKKAPFNFAFSEKPLRLTPRIRRKRVIPLLLWICCILPKAHSFTPHFRQKREVWLHYFTEKAKFDSAFSPKTRSLTPLFRRKRPKWSEKIYPSFSATMLSHASRFRRKRGVIENFENLGEFKEYFRKCRLYCVYIKIQKRTV